MYQSAQNDMYQSAQNDVYCPGQSGRHHSVNGCWSDLPFEIEPICSCSQ